MRSTPVNSAESLRSFLILYYFSISNLSLVILSTLSNLILLSSSVNLFHSLIFACCFSSRKNLVSLSHIYLISSLPFFLASSGEFPSALYFLGENMSRSYVVEYILGTFALKGVLPL